MTMDPRLSERRREVAEDHARVDVRRVVWLLATLGSIGLAIWLATSPMLSVQTIAVFGAENAQVIEVLTAQEVVNGRPLIAIRTGPVAAALAEDPWVRAAGVELIFPSHVEVTIEERVAAVWTQSDDSRSQRWVLVAEDGVAVRYGDSPTTEGVLVEIPIADPGLGSTIADPFVLGAIEFVSALPPTLASTTSIRLSEGDLWAWVDGRNVRLGQPSEMEAKALAVAAIIDSSPPGVIDVIAPSRPAVWADEADAAKAEVEGEVESFTDG